jgi:two-component system OmpR family response regulator
LSANNPQRDAAQPDAGFPPLRRILLVDDQRVMRSIAELSLVKLGGFTLQACASGEEALQHAVAFAPDLLLLDMIMPVMDGVATLAQLRALGITTPAVFFTGRVEAADLAVFRGLGALGVIAKPFDPLKLPPQLLALWKRHHEAPAGVDGAGAVLKL